MMVGVHARLFAKIILVGLLCGAVSSAESRTTWAEQTLCEACATACAGYQQQPVTAGQQEFCRVCSSVCSMITGGQWLRGVAQAALTPQLQQPYAAQPAYYPSVAYPTTGQQPYAARPAYYGQPSYYPSYSSVAYPTTGQQYPSLAPILGVAPSAPGPIPGVSPTPTVRPATHGTSLFTIYSDGMGSAGVLPIYWADNQKQYVIVAQDRTSGEWGDFGGAMEWGDGNDPALTAARKFHEGAITDLTLSMPRNMVSAFVAENSPHVEEIITRWQRAQQPMLKHTIYFVRLSPQQAQMLLGGFGQVLGTATGQPGVSPIFTGNAAVASIDFGDFRQVIATGATRALKAFAVDSRGNLMPPIGVKLRNLLVDALRPWARGDGWVMGSSPKVRIYAN